MAKFRESKALGVMVVEAAVYVGEALVVRFVTQVTCLAKFFSKRQLEFKLRLQILPLWISTN
jgi:hypothetical protein